MNTLALVSALVAGYFVGSISWAVLIARRFGGVNIFEHGSGNPGATNVRRVIGKTAGNACFALDALKGVVAAGWPLIAFAGDEFILLYQFSGLVGAILGHSFSIFLKFRGGKGVATTIGGLVVIMPVILLGGLVVWFLVFTLSRYVSLASICLGVSLPITALLLTGSEDSNFKLWLSLLLAVFIVLRHISNIKRLLRGQENRFGK